MVSTIALIRQAAQLLAEAEQVERQAEDKHHYADSIAATRGEVGDLISWIEDGIA